jgi:DNA-binding response OmpR family regulator
MVAVGSRQSQPSRGGTIVSRILIVEDDPLLSTELTRALSSDAFECHVATDGQTGLEMALEDTYDLVMLDIMLPKLNGYQACAELRARDMLVPILMLTAKVGEWDEAEALDTGADDYLAKPVSMVVLKAHVHALIRRSQLLPVSRVTWAGLTLDRTARTCSSTDAVVQLTGREVEVMARLMLAQGSPVSKDELISVIWGGCDAFAADRNIIVVYVKRLREKLRGPFGHSVIETVHGVGYRVAEPQ